MEGLGSDAKVKKLMFYRWLIWGILLIPYMISFFHRMVAGVVSEDLVREFGLSATTFASLSSMYFYAYLVMQIPAGLMADSIGARKTVTAGILSAGAGSVLFGLAPSVAWLFVGRLLVGVGVSVVFVAILKIISEWFKESEFGAMSGATSFIGGMGGVLSQTPVAVLIGYLSWRYTFVLVGVLSLGMGLLIYLIVRNAPAEMGLPSPHDQEKGAAGEYAGPEIQSPAQESPPLLKSLIEVLANKNMYPGILLFAAYAGAHACMVSTWGNSYLTNVYGFSRVVASSYITLPILGLAVGCLIIGKISDMIKKRKIPMYIFGGINLLCWGIIVFSNGGKPPVKLLPCLLFTMGLTAAVFVPLWACGKELNHPAAAGISVSVINSGGFIGQGILPVVLGRVFDVLGNSLPPVELYHKAFFYCFISALIGFLSIILIKETNCRNIYFLSKTGARDDSLNTATGVQVHGR